MPVVWYSGTSGPVLRSLENEGVFTWYQPITIDNPSLLYCAIEKIEQIGPHLFHSFDYGDTFSDVLAARAAGVSFCFSSRQDIKKFVSAATDSNTVGFASDVFSLAGERLRTKLCNGIFANCEAVKTFCISIENLSDDVVLTIPNGVELPDCYSPLASLKEHLGIPSEAIVLGNVATLKPTKGHDVLLRAFAKISNNVKNSFLLLCGDGRLRDPILNQLRELNLVERVFLLGEVVNTDECFRSLDIYVHSSRSEGLPNALLEAMSYSLPVVATRVGGTSEAVEDGETGLLVDPENADYLAFALEKLIHNRALRLTMGAKARVSVATRFSVERMVDRYETVYSAFLRSCKKGAPVRQAI